MERLKATDRYDIRQQTQSAVSAYDAGYVLDVLELRDKVSADLRNANLNPALREMKCLEPLGYSKGNPSSYKKIDDPRLHTDEITRKKPYPTMCGNCDLRKGSNCLELGAARTEAGIK